MPRERYLLRAGREGYTYREILEVRPGALRLLQPSRRARRLCRWTSTLFALGFVLVFGSFLNTVAQGGIVVSGIVGVVIAAGLAAFYLTGLVLLLLWWDDRNLPLLAEDPDSATTVEVLGVSSFGTFQELRARADGRELRIAVHGSKPRVGEALQFAGFTMA